MMRAPGGFSAVEIHYHPARCLLPENKLIRYLSKVYEADSSAKAVLKMICGMLFYLFFLISAFFTL